MALTASARRRGLSRGRSRLVGFTAATVALTTLAACGGGSGSSSSSSTAAANVSAPVLANLSGAEKTRVANLIAQAKSEGQLDWIGTVVSTSKDPLIAEFKKEYGLSSLKINFENQQSSDITARVQSEVTSRHITTDLVAVDGAPSFFTALKQANALVKYDSPKLAAYQGSDKYLNDDFGYWVSPDALMYLPIYNPKLWTKPINSWNDLIDPALKGKVSFPGVPSSASAAFTYWGLRQVLPASYFQKLADVVQPQVGVGNGTTAAQMAAQGELLVAITSSHNVVKVSKKLGVPLAVAFPKEGAAMIGWSFGILDGSPHPAAAKLFEDFVLGKTAQGIIVDNEYLTPARNDVTVPADLAKVAPPTLQDAHAIALDKNPSKDTITKARAEFSSIFTKK